MEMEMECFLPLTSRRRRSVQIQLVIRISSQTNSVCPKPSDLPMMMVRRPLSLRVTVKDFVDALLVYPTTTRPRSSRSFPFRFAYPAPSATSR